jgi:hypothetical protein
VCSDEHCGKSRRPGAEDRELLSTCRVLYDRTIKRSGDVVCDLHRAQVDKECEFLGLASKPRSMVSPGLSSKSVASGFLAQASKPVATVWSFGPQN